MPVAVISSPATGTTVSRGQEVTFSSAGSNDDLDAEFGGRIVGYAWDFGDGTTSTEAAPKKAYAAISPAGGYTVRLAVFDDAGQTASTEIKVIVANRLPTVTIVASTTSGVAPLTVDFSSIVVDETTMSPNPALTYAWNFGDGGTSTLADPPARTYSTTGTRSVTLTVTDDQGATATATQTITVGAPLLAAPTGLRFVRAGTAVGTRNMDLSWTARSGATLYEVRLICDGCPDIALRHLRDDLGPCERPPQRPHLLLRRRPGPELHRRLGPVVRERQGPIVTVRDVAVSASTTRAGARAAS